MSGQKVSSPELATETRDLANQTFIIKEIEETKKNGDDLKLYLLFHRNGKAIFRVKRGNMFTKANILNWRLIEALPHRPIGLIIGGNTQTIDREQTNYVIEKR